MQLRRIAVWLALVASVVAVGLVAFVGPRPMVRALDEVPRGVDTQMNT